jgi:hypothetical protein
MDNPEKLATYSIQDEENQNRKTTQYVLKTTVRKQTQITLIRHVHVFFPVSLPRPLPDMIAYILITRWESYKKLELLTLREHLSSPRF